MITIPKHIARSVYTFGDTMKDETFKEKVGEMSVKLLSRTANVGNDEGLDIDIDLGEEESEGTFGDAPERERNG